MRTAAADRKIPVFSVEMNEKGEVQHGRRSHRRYRNRAHCRRHCSGPAHQRKHGPSQARAFAAFQPGGILGKYRKHLRAYRGRCFAVYHAAVPHSWVDWLNHGDFAFRWHRGGSHKIQRAFFLADGARKSRDLVFGSAHDASASAGPSHHKPAEAATLRFIRSCSAPLSPELIHKIEDVFGVPFVEAYGMTEAAHQMTSNPLPPRHRKAGSVGVGVGLRISIMDKDGNHLGTNQRGEIAIQGANVFRGYENNPEANARAFVNGWFRTGDQGLLDSDCYLHLTGRIKDIIIRGGENIAPHEVDEILLRHPAVAAAVTFGCLHPTLGEEVAAAVVLHERHGATEAELIKHCRELLAEYKCPTKIYLVESIPTTATGKIRRRAVATALTDDGNE